MHPIRLRWIYAALSVNLAVAARISWLSMYVTNPSRLRSPVYFYASVAPLPNSSRVGKPVMETSAASLSVPSILAMRTSLLSA